MTGANTIAVAKYQLRLATIAARHSLVTFGCKPRALGGHMLAAAVGEHYFKNAPELMRYFDSVVHRAR